MQDFDKECLVDRTWDTIQEPRYRIRKKSDTHTQATCGQEHEQGASLMIRSNGWTDAADRPEFMIHGSIVCF